MTKSLRVFQNSGRQLLKLLALNLVNLLQFFLFDFLIFLFIFLIVNFLDHLWVLLFPLLLDQAYGLLVRRLLRLRINFRFGGCHQRLRELLHSVGILFNLLGQDLGIK